MEINYIQAPAFTIEVVNVATVVAAEYNFVLPLLSVQTAPVVPDNIAVTAHFVADTVALDTSVEHTISVEFVRFATMLFLIGTIVPALNTPAPQAAFVPTPVLYVALAPYVPPLASSSI
jgi:hypothetical protein